MTRALSFIITSNFLLLILCHSYTSTMEPMKEEPSTSRLYALPPELRAQTLLTTIMKELQSKMGRKMLMRAHKALAPHEEPQLELDEDDIQFIIAKLQPSFSHKDFSTSRTIGTVLSRLAPYYKGSLKELGLKIKEGFPEKEYPFFNQALQEWLKEQAAKETQSSQSRL